jgi:hypothetical protein
MKVEPTPKIPHPQAQARTMPGVMTMVEHKRKVRNMAISNTPPILPGAVQRRRTSIGIDSSGCQ